MAGRRNPFKEIEEMMNRMGRQFEESMGGSEIEQLTGGADASVDVADHGDEIVVTADLPGFEKDEIDVTVRGETLRIGAEHEQASDEESDEGRYIRKERRHKSVSRSVHLPEEVEEGNASADYRNGVLTVTLPKRSAEQGDSHQIDIS